MKIFVLPANFFSIEVKVDRIVATEEELGKIFDAAFKGITGDSLALASGFMPKAFAVLRESDENVANAISVGTAMNEMMLSTVANEKAIDERDLKALQFLLTHKHNWKPARPDNDANGDVTINVRNWLPDPEINDN